MGFSQPSLTDPSPRTHTLYIGGAWSEPAAGTMLDVVNPATEAVLTQVALGSGADVDRAVAAARSALPAWSATSPAERKALLEQIHQVYSSRLQELADTISAEMGAPKQLALLAQAGSGLAHLSTAIELLDSFEFTEQRGTSIIVHEPIGVCGLITPWNWPANQIMCKVAPAIAAGCASSDRDLRRGWRAGGRVQPGHWRWADGRRGHFGASRHRYGVFYRLDACRGCRRAGRCAVG
jgi:aldehyde dehydrogenase (NAD+)